MNNKLNDAQQMKIGRRRLLKMMATGVVAGAVLSSVASLPVASAAETGNGLTGNKSKKILIVYFSRSGNTKNVANQIQSVTGADVVELKTVQPYPNDYHATTVQAQKELSENFYPILSTKIDNISQYDVILIGSPNWWGTMSSPVRSFLSGHDLANKTVSLFITHEGSGLGRGMRDLQSFCPNSTILDGLAIRGNRAVNAKSEITQWLNRLGLTQ